VQVYYNIERVEEDVTPAFTLDFVFCILFCTLIADHFSIQFFYVHIYFKRENFMLQTDCVFLVVQGLRHMFHIF